MFTIFSPLNSISRCIQTNGVIGRFLYIWGEHWTADMEITAECLNSHFITPFLLTCICSRNWFFFLSVFSFFFFPLPSSLRLLEEVEQAAAVSGYRDVVSVESVRLRPVGAFSYGHIYRKPASGAVGWSCYVPPLNAVCLYVNLTVCLLLLPVCAEASCPIFTIYFLTLPASPSLYPTVWPCRTHWLSLYIWPCCSLCAWRSDCHGYCYLLWGWQRGWKP